ncbi:Dolichyl-diphosphooligosaccharide--protein glycosyltransferase subunit 1 [Thelohanellus kitauei]|uniref:Dolichyl-diphosphooligosaccharide--protein glycosyltransferase subunit 1 n=1 Tax=Thelohanellus kitauei TaxID=669202 RepID=A0A0C2MQ60_THEKT|nr:Dolichyl-diphosphooligosaccharide--protein glycosyltransferase subunit 1 [Thelohanellus kitauei]
MECPILLLSLFLVSLNAALKTLKFESVERVIKLDSHKIKAQYKIMAKNHGKTPESSVEMIFKKSICDTIFKIGAEQSGTQIPVTERRVLSEEYIFNKLSTRYCFYKLDLKAPIESNHSVDFVVSLIFANRFQPFPEQVVQNGQHTFMFHDDYFIDSIYEVVRQTTIYEVRKEAVVSITEDQKIKQDKLAIRLPDAFDIPPFSTKEFFVFFKYFNPIFVLAQYSKVYQISEWGIISVMEEFWVSNRAAMLKGSYSRFTDNQQDKQAVYSWEMRIPSNAYGIYYRDGLGNISTSSVTRHSSEKVLHLQPRFPIFGGWKTYYYVAYTLPPRYFLYKNQESRRSRFTFDLLGSPMENYLIENGTVKVRLPEGATDVKVSLGKTGISSFKHSFEHSYLDFYGRPVVEFQIDHACKEKDGLITITFSYDQRLLLQKPIVVSATIFIIMISIFLVTKMGSPILATEESQKQETVQYYVEEIRAKVDATRKLCQDYMEAISTYKIQKNMDKLRSKLNKLNPEIEANYNQIVSSFSSLKNMNKDYASKLDHYRTKHEERMKLLNSYEEMSKKVVSGQMTRDEYVKVCQPTEEQIQKAGETIEQIVNTM